MLVSIKADLYELGAPDITAFPGLDTDDTRLIVAAFGKDGPPVAAKRLTVKDRQFPVIVELTVDDLAFPLTKVCMRSACLDAVAPISLSSAYFLDHCGLITCLVVGESLPYQVGQSLR